MIKGITLQTEIIGLGVPYYYNDMLVIYMLTQSPIKTC